MKKTLGYFHIVLGLTKMSITDLVNLAFALIYDTDIDYTVHPYTQAQLRALATTVQTELGTRLTAPNPTLTKQEQLDVDALSRAIIAIASGVTIAANNKAKGNRALFDIVVKRIGFTSAVAHRKHVRIWEVKNAGKGIFYVIGPVEKGLGRVTYVFEMGICTALGVMPAKWLDPISLPMPEFYISSLPIGTFLAFRYGAVVVPSHKKKVATGGANTQRTVAQTAALHTMVTILPVNTHGKVQLVWGVPFIQFSDPIWMTVS